jgi:hypothetical protein
MLLLLAGHAVELHEEAGKLRSLPLGGGPVGADSALAAVAALSLPLRSDRLAGASVRPPRST